MNKKREPLLNENTKHKKKSTTKGQPRADHKHIYETVLLTSEFHSVDFTNGQPRTTYYEYPAKVCSICGRIDGVDHDEKFYKPKVEVSFSTWRTEKELSPEALKLPRWRADFFDKFAEKIED